MSITVTATQGGTTRNNGMLLRVEVLNGTAASQAGAAVANQTGPAAHTASITTTTTGSLVYGAITDGHGTSLSGTFSAGLTVIDDVVDSTNAQCYATVVTSSATGTPGAVTYGSVASFAGGLALLEILPNGTISTDGSSPAVATTFTAETITTAAFTPPAGSLLVALVCVAATFNDSVNVTVSGGGLVWTEAINAASTSNGYLGIWIARVPAPVATPPRQQLAHGRPGTVRGTGKGSAGAKYIAFPSKFTLPAKPAKGAPAAVQGKAKGSPGAAYVFIPPPFTTRYTGGAAKGKPGIRRGSGSGSPGAPYLFIPVAPWPFIAPREPAKGAPAIRRGTGLGHAGARYVTFPSVFIPPHKPAKGASAIRRGTGTGHTGARFVLIQTSRFTLPKRPARGTGIARAGRGAGSVTGKGAAFVPRQLIISLASQAGTDDYGNTFPQGVQVGSPAGASQVQLIPALTGSGASQVAFPFPGHPVSNVPNIAAEVVTSADTPILIASGPASAITGHQDWIQVLWWANDGTNPARLEFRYIDTVGAFHIMATLSASGWTFSGSCPLIAQDGLSVSGGTVTDDLTVTSLLDVSGILEVTGFTISLGDNVDIPQAEPTGASSAPTSYNQTWGSTVVNAIDNLIIALRNGGILT